MGWIWFFGALAFFSFGMYRLGLAEIDAQEKEAFFWVICMVTVLWPVVLGCVIVFGPFVGFFWLGDRKRKQLLEKEKSAKNK